MKDARAKPLVVTSPPLSDEPTVGTVKESLAQFAYAQVAAHRGELERKLRQAYDLVLEQAREQGVDASKALRRARAGAAIRRQRVKLAFKRRDPVL